MTTIAPQVPIPEVVEGATADEARGLVSQVVHVPAGSTLVFFESLLHASGAISSGKDRLLIIAGYTPGRERSAIGRLGGSLEPHGCLLVQNGSYS